MVIFLILLICVNYGTMRKWFNKDCCTILRIKKKESQNDEHQILILPKNTHRNEKHSR